MVAGSFFTSKSHNCLNSGGCRPNSRVNGITEQVSLSQRENYGAKIKKTRQCGSVMTKESDAAG